MFIKKIWRLKGKKSHSKKLFSIKNNIFDAKLVKNYLKNVF